MHFSYVSLLFLYFSSWRPVCYCFPCPRFQKSCVLVRARKFFLCLQFVVLVAAVHPRQLAEPGSLVAFCVSFHRVPLGTADPYSRWNANGDTMGARLEIQ